MKQIEVDLKEEHIEREVGEKDENDEERIKIFFIGVLTSFGMEPPEIKESYEINDYGRKNDTTFTVRLSIREEVIEKLEEDRRVRVR